MDCGFNLKLLFIKRDQSADVHVSLHVKAYASNKFFLKTSITNSLKNVKNRQNSQNKDFESRSQANQGNQTLNFV